MDESETEHLKDFMALYLVRRDEEAAIMKSMAKGGRK